MRIAALVFKYWSLFLLNVLTNVKKLLSLRFVTHLFFFWPFFFLLCVSTARKIREAHSTANLVV